MISKSKQSIIITQSTKPIHLLKQITPKNTQPNSNQDLTYFLISTVDRQIIFIEIDHANVLTCRHVVKDVGDIVTAIYYGEDDGVVLLGCANGGVVGVQLDVPKVGGIKLVKQKLVYKEENPSTQKTIILLYTAKDSIFVFNLAGQLKIIHKSGTKQPQYYKFTYEITAAIYFRICSNPDNLGCVSFNSGQPPTIFNCSSVQKFISTYKNTHKLYKKYELSEFQITAISDTTYRTSSQTYIVCSSSDLRSNGNFVILYSYKYIEKYNLEFLEPVYKFDVKGFVLYLSVKEKLCMVCLYNSLIFFEVATRKRVLLIEKSDLEVTVGIILRGGNQGVKFMAYKGFNFLQTQKFQDRELKLRIRSKNYDESKSK